MTDELPDPTPPDPLPDPLPQPLPQSPDPGMLRVGTVHLRNLGGRIDKAAYYNVMTMLRQRQITVQGTLYEQEGQIGTFWVYKAIEVSGAAQTAEIEGVVELTEPPHVVTWPEVDQWFAATFAHDNTEPVAMSRVKDLYSILQAVRAQEPPRE